VQRGKGIEREREGGQTDSQSNGLVNFHFSMQILTSSKMLHTPKKNKRNEASQKFDLP